MTAPPAPEPAATAVPPTSQPPAAASPSPSEGTFVSARRDPSTVWKVMTAILAVTTVGFAIWAIVLLMGAQSDNDSAAEALAAVEQERDDLTAQVADLEAQNAELQDQAGKLTEETKTALTQAVEALGVAAGELNVSQQQVTDATAALEAANTALEQAQGDLATAQAERDQALAVADLAKLCAGGSIGAIDLIAADDVDGATALLETVAPACEAAFGQE